MYKKLLQSIFHKIPLKSFFKGFILSNKDSGQNTKEKLLASTNVIHSPPQLQFPIVLYHSLFMEITLSFLSCFLAATILKYVTIHILI